MCERSLDVAAMLVLVGVDSHGAELEDRERVHVVAEPPLAEEHWPLRVELDADRDQDQERPQHYEHRRGDDVVDAALQQSRGT